MSIAVFDMDGVLVDVKSSWQYLHEAFGANNTKNVERYLEGRITYRELMKRDIALWGRVHISKIKSILSEAPLMPGAVETFSRLKKTTLETVIISAGVSILADRLQATLGLDRVFANRILTDQLGFVTGEGEKTVGLTEKLLVLENLAIAENVSLTECVVVGDSVYDIPMFKKAGLSIAFNTDERDVQNAADVVVKEKDLRGILPYLTSSR